MWLQRDYGLCLANLFDTGQASRVLCMAGNGLAHLLDHYCGFKADKRFQLADWRLRPLGEEMVRYARSDTHYLLYCYDKLRVGGWGVGGGGWACAVVRCHLSFAVIDLSGALGCEELMVAVERCCTLIPLCRTAFRAAAGGAGGGGGRGARGAAGGAARQPGGRRRCAGHRAGAQPQVNSQKCPPRVPRL